MFNADPLKTSERAKSAPKGSCSALYGEAMEAMAAVWSTDYRIYRTEWFKNSAQVLLILSWQLSSSGEQI